MSQVRTGGQRTPVWRRIYWENHYTRYFFGKYYEAYARRLGLWAPRPLALAAFMVFSLYKELLRPALHRGVMALIKRRAKPLAASTAH